MIRKPPFHLAAPVRRTVLRRAAIGVAAALAASSALADTTILFTLDGDYVTSAGVYDVDNGYRLVRTLTRGVKLGAGAHALTWDNRDDAGQLLPATRSAPVGTVPANYQVRLLKNAVTYTWEGVVGNTSDSFTGTGNFHPYQSPTSMTSTADTVYFTNGYNEAGAFGFGFKTSDPGTRLYTMTPSDDVTAGAADMFVSMDMAVTDGTRMYWANTGNGFQSDPVNAFYTFVAATDLATGKYSSFSAGQALCLNHRASGDCYPGQNYLSVTGVQTAREQQPTGIAVQTNGNILAVARGAVGLVQLFDKNTGALLRSFPIPATRYSDHVQNQLAMTPAGDLWVLGSKVATIYSGLQDPGGPTIGQTIDGLVHPLAIAVSPNPVGDLLMIVDGSPVSAVRFYDSSGDSMGLLGQYRGYRDDPAVQPTKFSFTNNINVGAAGPTGFQVTERSAITILPDESFWVSDNGNGRLLHFSASHALIGSLAFRPASYIATVDPGNPSRVFSNFLEYQVDTAHPLQPGASSSWTLVRNWQDSMPAAVANLDWAWGGFHTVVTLSNGRTYALANSNDATGSAHLFELPASGPARDTGITTSSACADSRPTTRCVLYENGDLGYAVIPTTDANLTVYTQPVQYVYRRALTGFDTSGNPTWAAAQLVASYDASAGGTNHPYNHGAWSGTVGSRFPIVAITPASRQVVFLDQTVDSYVTGTTPSVVSPVQGNEGNHLGALPYGTSAVAATRFTWEASATGPMDPTLGTFQTKALDGTVNYGGNLVWASGEHVVYGYHGEFLTDLSPAHRGTGEGNQFMHFHQDGLFIGEFGNPNFPTITESSQAGVAGNAFSNILLPTGDGALYWYHNDENTHGGVHRWRIDNLSSVKELTATGRLNGAPFQLH